MSDKEKAKDAALGDESRSLKAALRRARLSQAERNDVIVEMRATEHARLELLHEELQPVFNETPEGDQFECALVPGDPPRLWIDMLAYVVMGPNRRTYRFVKDTRNGRQIMHESDRAGDMADAVTEYIAHRVLDRERALESEASTAPDIMQSAPPAKLEGYRGRTLALAFVGGVILGAAILFVWASIAGSVAG